MTRLTEAWSSVWHVLFHSRAKRFARGLLRWKSPRLRYGIDGKTKGRVQCSFFLCVRYCPVGERHGRIGNSDDKLDFRLCTWRALTGELVGEWINDAKLKCVAKLGESKIIFGGSNGNVTSLTRQSGSALQVHRRLLDPHRCTVNDITVHGDLFLTCSNDRTAKVWDSNTLILSVTWTTVVGSNVSL